jgi:hypothetical protein
MMQRVYVFLIVVAGAALIALTLFTYPAADDFCFQEKAVRLGFLGAQADWYTTWSGRYTATALTSGLMLAGTSWYSLALVLVALSWLVSLWLLLAACAGNAFPARAVTLASVTVFVMYGAFAPNPNGAFYWASAALTYQFAGTLLVLMLAINIRLTRTSAQGRAGAGLVVPIIANFFLGLALGGTNETVLLLAMILLAAGAVVARHCSHRAALPWLAGLSGVALGFVVVLLAPGNEVRWQYFPEGRNLILSLPRTAIRTLLFIVRESANPALWLAAGLVAVPLWNCLTDATRDWLVKRRGWLILLVSWVAMIAACFFPAEYAFGAGPPGRARNIAFVVLLLGWIPVAGVLAERFWSGRHLFIPSPRTKPLLLVALGLTLAGGAQMREIYRDLGSGPEFRKELAEREAAIRKAAAQGLETVEVPPLAVRTKHIYELNVIGDNNCQALASGLKTVRVRSALDPQQQR